MGLAAKILTVSDSVSRGSATDRSGPAIGEYLEGHGFEVVDQRVIADDVWDVQQAIRALATGFAGLVVTTGGTGFGPRDMTPEGTEAVIERRAPGLAEAMRAVDPLGRLSRGLAGSVGQALVINLPGSSKAVEPCLGAVIDILPHALDLLAGRDTQHPHAH